MKKNHLYLFNKTPDLPYLVGLFNPSEVFVRGSFIETKNFLICLSDDFSFRKEINFKELKPFLISQEALSINEFHEKYNNQLKSIFDLQKKEKYTFSWLEKVQLAYLIQNDLSEINILQNVKILDQFYQKNRKN